MFNLKKYRPLTPSLRFKSLVNKSILWNGKKINNLTFSLKINTGRSNNGHIILYTRSKNYHKKIYRLINFNYLNFGIPFKIHRIEYDPNRSSFLSLIYFYNNLLAYTLHINGVNEGANKNSFLYSINNLINVKGNNTIIKSIPDNAIISLIESKPLFGAIYSRSAGSYALLVQKYLNLNKALLKLKSGKLKFISLDCKATLGTISNTFFKHQVFGKAGRSRWFGIKPNVRGVAMNPVDHPHGGGQGKKSKRPSPKSPWGKILKWKKTSNSRTYINRII